MSFCDRCAISYTDARTHGVWALQHTCAISNTQACVRVNDSTCMMYWSSNTTSYMCYHLHWCTHTHTTSYMCYRLHWRTHTYTTSYLCYRLHWHMRTYTTSYMCYHLHWRTHTYTTKACESWCGVLMTHSLWRTYSLVHFKCDIDVGTCIQTLIHKNI